MKTVRRLLPLLPLALALPLAAQDATPDAAELEARFAALLTDSRLVGSFTLDGAPERPPSPETYAIRSAEKVSDGVWRITAEVSYGKGKIPFAMDVGVEWAGDTPMIQLTKREIPLMGQYSARVLFYEDRYAGTWSGVGHGGHLFGYVKRGADAGATDEAAAPGAEGAGDAQQDAGGGRDGGALPGEGFGTNRNVLPSDAGTSWPSFRGPMASGVAEGFATPAAFDLEKGENVLFRVPIPGLAHSSPVIWGDRVYLTTAVKEAEGDAELTVGLYGSIQSVEDEGVHRFQVLCLDKRTGDVLWERTAIEAVPRIKRHPKGSHAASTPATDGEHVVAFFGSEGLYAYDAAGELLWKKDFGLLDSGFYMVPTAQWGFASSPVIVDGKVVVQCDVQGDSFVACLDVTDGKELWRTEREEVPTWSTPTVDPASGRIYVNGYKHIGGYDLETGDELWFLEGGGDIPVPTPVLGHGLVFITNAHGRMAPIFAIRADAEGFLTMNPKESDAVVWMNPRQGNYMQTPLVVGDYLYCCSDAGVLRCYEAESGEERYSERISTDGGGFTGSGVAADGKLYFTSEEGGVHVVRAGPEFELLGVSELGETCMSSPAISAGSLYFRTRGHLVAIADAE